MYNNYSIAGASVAGPATASMLPLDFPLGPQTEPFWLVLGGFAIFAALSAAKRIAPTWSQLVDEPSTETTAPEIAAHEVAPVSTPTRGQARASARSYRGAHRRPRVGLARRAAEGAVA